MPVMQQTYLGSLGVLAGSMGSQVVSRHTLAQQVLTGFMEEVIAAMARHALYCTIVSASATCMRAHHANVVLNLCL